MKHTISVCVVFAVFVLLFPVAGTTQPKTKRKPLIAVMPFKVDSADKVSAGKTPASIRYIWAEELVKSGKVRVLSFKTIDARLKAKSLVWEYNLESQKTTEIGKALGVKYLIAGNVTYVEEGVAASSAATTQKTSRTTVRILNASTGETIWSDEVTEQSSESRDVHRKATKRGREQLEKNLDAEAQKPPKKADGQTCVTSVDCAGGGCRAATCYTPSSKAFGQSCNFNAECRVGKCSAELLGLINGTCVCNEDWHCGTGNYCNKGFAGIGSNDCRPKLNQGQLCSKDHQCRSGRCSITCRD